MERQFTCIVCPMGCTITARLENGIPVSIAGNTCPRGEEYVRNEITNPVRVVTTTIRHTDGRTVSVKTGKAISKDKIFECMKEINSAKIILPISVGDVIIKGVCGTDADVVATSRLDLGENDE